MSIGGLISRTPGVDQGTGVDGKEKMDRKGEQGRKPERLRRVEGDKCARPYTNRELLRSAAGVFVFRSTYIMPTSK